MFGHFQQIAVVRSTQSSVEHDGFFQQLDLTEFISESAVTLGADHDLLSRLSEIPKAQIQRASIAARSQLIPGRRIGYFLYNEICVVEKQNRGLNDNKQNRLPHQRSSISGMDQCLQTSYRTNQNERDR